MPGRNWQPKGGNIVSSTLAAPCILANTILCCGCVVAVVCIFFLVVVVVSCIVARNLALKGGTKLLST